MHNPKVFHWQAVNRILEYLKHTTHLGLHIQPCSTYTLHGFTDANCVECPNDQGSTGGFYIFSNFEIVSWESKKQNTIPHSNTEAEYKALTKTTVEFL